MFIRLKDGRIINKNHIKYIREHKRIENKRLNCLIELTISPKGGTQKVYTEETLDELWNLLNPPQVVRTWNSFGDTAELRDPVPPVCPNHQPEWIQPQMPYGKPLEIVCNSTNQLEVQ